LLFWNNDPYGKILKICFESFHRLTDRRSTSLYSDVVKFVRLEIDKIVRHLPHKKTTEFGSLSRCRYYADRAQNLPGPAPNI